MTRGGDWGGGGGGGGVGVVAANVWCISVDCSLYACGVQRSEFRAEENKWKKEIKINC